MIIVGAGLAGLLAANMLNRHQPLIIEKQSTLPNNHTAVLRFRSPLVGDTIGIPFREVNLIKANIPWANPVADALAYSLKGTGVSRSDRSIKGEVVEERRYIAPPDLISRMATNINISFNIEVEKSCAGDRPIISTMPMPALMKLLNYPKGVAHLFRYVEGVNIRATIKDCDAYVSLMVPNPNMPFSRVSITGDELILELPGWDHPEIRPMDFVAMAAHLLGIEIKRISGAQAFPQKYFKIAPVAEGVRKEFMHWATVHHNIYSLGRYATWRPGLLMDELVKDIKLIERWAANGTKYEVAQHNMRNVK